MWRRRPEAERLTGIRLVFSTTPDLGLLGKIVAGIQRNGAFQPDYGYTTGTPAVLTFGFVSKAPLDRRLEACREVRALVSRIGAERDQPKPQLATF